MDWEYELEDGIVRSLSIPVDGLYRHHSSEFNLPSDQFSTPVIPLHLPPLPEIIVFEPDLPFEQRLAPIYRRRDDLPCRCAGALDGLPPNRGSNIPGTSGPPYPQRIDYPLPRPPRQFPPFPPIQKDYPGPAKNDRLPDNGYRPAINPDAISGGSIYRPRLKPKDIPEASRPIPKLVPDTSREKDRMRPPLAARTDGLRPTTKGGSDNMILAKYPDGAEVRESFSERNAGIPGRIFELHHLKHRTGNHKTPDAMVYISDKFDPGKPVRVLVFNHGLRTDVKEVFKHGELAKQMASADANTILIVPEWQQRPGTNDKKSDFYKPGFFKSLLQEIFSRTPALQTKTLDDIGSIGLIAHSGGYNATMAEVDKNELGHKVTSITLLDSLYGDAKFDKWIGGNIKELATGTKNLHVIFTPGGGTEENSRALAWRINQMLKKNNLPGSSMSIDLQNTRIPLEPLMVQNKGIVFKKSTVNVRDASSKGYRGAHSSVVNVSLRPIVVAEVQRNAGRT